ncbi:UNVERIFIED_CONTAM: hypothetical protein ABID98_004058 [Brevibacillus sp. OAP136]
MFDKPPPRPLCSMSGSHSAGAYVDLKVARLCFLLLSPTDFVPSYLNTKCFFSLYKKICKKERQRATPFVYVTTPVLVSRLQRYGIPAGSIHLHPDLPP